MIPGARVHHIGIAVFDIEATALKYERNGYKRSEVVYDPIQRVNICWLTKENDPVIELLSSGSENSPVNKVLEKNGVSPYHICYEVDNLDEAILDLRRERFILVSKPAPAVAFKGSSVAFLYHKDVGLIELVQSPAEILI